jgi:hypothetical protein
MLRLAPVHFVLAPAAEQEGLKSSSALSDKITNNGCSLEIVEKR